VDFREWADDLSRWGATRARNVMLLDAVDSTHRCGRAVAAEALELDLTAWIFALRQRAGRGRLGRPWSSPAGAGVYASWVLRAPRAGLATLPLLVGVGLCEGLGALGFGCGLKWPNDLQIGGAKVGGILLESRGRCDPAVVVASFGVNHSHRRSDLPAAGAASLALLDPGRLPKLSALTRVLAEAVEEELAGHGARHSWNPRHAVERYSAWTVHRTGDRLEVRSGDEVCAGEFVGFSAGGHLRLRTAAGERRFVAGEVAGRA